MAKGKLDTLCQPYIKVCQLCHGSDDDDDDDDDDDT